LAVEAARDAGGPLREEFHRPGGPRGRAGHAEIAEVVEAAIRRRLSAAFPAYGIRGEALSNEDRPPTDADHHGWLIDPDNGTAAFLAGWRGPAVSIALLRRGVPVLGVVYASAAPDDDGDLVAWAEGEPLTRNGRPVIRGWAAALGPEHTGLVAQGADRRPEATARGCASARFRAVPSIAYRLALVAVGEAEVGVSLNHPGDWDVAAGHALLARGWWPALRRLGSVGGLRRARGPELTRLLRWCAWPSPGPGPA
jgi:fructose-1,6-bisphosphatase/inositol monophosphatase family enzyme